MDYNSINNCMSNRQKLSMMAADLQQMAGATPNTYDEINDKMTDQQKLSLMASAIETIKNQGGGEKAPLYISPYFQDYSDDGLSEDEGDIEGIQGRGTTYEMLSDFVLFGQDPEYARSFLCIPSIGLYDGSYANATVPTQYGIDDSGDIVFVFSIFCANDNKYRTYSLTCTESLETAEDGHAVDAHWKRIITIPNGENMEF